MSTTPPMPPASDQPAAPAPLEAASPTTQEGAGVPARALSPTRQWAKDHTGAISRSVATAAILGLLGTWYDDLKTFWELPDRVAALEGQEELAERVVTLEKTIEEQSDALTSLQGKLALLENDLPYLKDDMKEVKSDVKDLLRSKD